MRKCILLALLSGCVDSPVLATLEPSPELASAILASAEPPQTWKEEGIARLRPAMVLSSFGEDDLGPVVEAMSDPDPFIRGVALTTLSLAISKGPLDMPEALVAIERIAADREVELARIAYELAWIYWRNLREHPNATVARFIADGVLDDTEARMLAVRRFSCKAISARPVLEYSRTFAAQRALEIRAKRCQRGISEP